MSIVRDFVFRFGIFAILFFLCVIAVSFGFPWVFEQFENSTSSPLPFEGTLRISILGIHALLLLSAGAWVLVHGNRVHRVVWYAFFISFVILGVIFIGDRTHRLLEEFSWIRYSTSMFLVLASLCGFALFVRIFRTKGFQQAVFWLLIGAGFLYGGLDEVFEIHEAIGRFLQRVFLYSGEVTDYVTIGYALIALIVILLLIRARLGEFVSRYRMSAYLFLGGVCMYALSTALDTIDVVVHSKLRSLANVLSVNSDVVMSDAWHMLWSVKNSFNGFEEVFEHTAALLFFIALVGVLFESMLMHDRSSIVFRWKRLLAGGICLVSILGMGILIVLSIPFTFPSSVVITKNVQVTHIASHVDGLFHADDLAFHASQGVIIANEGKGSVYRFQNGLFTKILDTKKIIHDPDSVTANKFGVFVSDGNAGNIIRFNKRGGEIVVGRSDGLVHPEGIAVAGENFYVLDESQKTLSRYSPGKKIENWKPVHPDWQTPEGISYDSTNDILYVTDDTTGAVFRVKFGKTLEMISKLSAPEDIEVLNDGSILVTDTAWGALFRIFPDGRKDNIIQFGRMYRDTQGVTIDEKGSIYVITADGFSSTSFMPSHLFRIDGVRL